MSSLDEEIASTIQEFRSYLPKGGGELTYFLFNRDSVGLASLIIFMMIFSIIVIKLFVYSDIFRRHNLCYPPAFYFGDWEGGKLHIYNAVHAEGGNEGFTQKETSLPHTNYDMDFFVNKLPERMIAATDNINQKLFAFIAENLHL
jgi:hypothetical protein